MHEPGRGVGGEVMVAPQPGVCSPAQVRRSASAFGLCTVGAPPGTRVHAYNRNSELSGGRGRRPDDAASLEIADTHVAGEGRADTSFVLARVFAADGAGVAACVGGE